MPRLVGPPLAGLPQTRHGFVPIDRHCRVTGLPGVYAAGDITTFPVKQGGIAAQQADVAAQAIALASGADVVPSPSARCSAECSSQDLHRSSCATISGIPPIRPS